MDAFVIPDQSFSSNAEVHLPKAIGRSLFGQSLQFSDHGRIITMTPVIANGPRKIHEFTGPTQTNLIRLLKMLNAYPFLGGP